MAALLDIIVPEHLWPALVEAAGFDAMKRVRDIVHPSIGRSWIGGTARFFDKGENDRWRSVLSDDDLASYEIKLKATLSSACASWLKHHALKQITAAPVQLSHFFGAPAYLLEGVDLQVRRRRLNDGRNWHRAAEPGMSVELRSGYGIPQA